MLDGRWQRGRLAVDDLTCRSRHRADLVVAHDPFVAALYPCDLEARPELDPGGTARRGWERRAVHGKHVIQSARHRALHRAWPYLVVREVDVSAVRRITVGRVI